jgi:hypothetical protein
MARRPTPRSQGTFSLPPLSPGLLRALGALLALWVAEMVIANFVLGSPQQLYLLLAWWPALDARLLYQPFTRLLVQGPNLFGVGLDLVVLYFFLPWTLDRFTRRQLLVAALVVLGGCVVAGVAWMGITVLAASAGAPASANWMSAPAMGWHPFVVALIVLYALSVPNAKINLFFLLEMEARWILWITVGFAVLGFLAQPGLPSFERFGAIGAAVLWFQLLGPGATRRRFAKVGKRIERDMRFKVHEGGRSRGPQGRSARDDDTWN